jgi:hypothetical protein
MRALLSVAVLCTALAVPRDAPRAQDLPPFVMLIDEWNAETLGTPDGRTFEGRWISRLDYHDRSNWTQEVIAVFGAARGLGSTFRCDAGWYSAYEAVTGSSPPPTFESGMCNGVGRWIRYGIVWSSFSWGRRDGPLPGQVTYEDRGERIVFDLKTGLPVRYDAGLTRGAPALIIQYELVR